jgi:hypothetical protein
MARGAIRESGCYCKRTVAHCMSFSCPKKLGIIRHLNDKWLLTAMKLFVGREAELEQFQQLLRKKTASLVVCQGRRRIGKSTFFREAAKAVDHFLLFEGLPPRDKLGRTEQLNAFAERLAEQTAVPQVGLASWPQAFQLLATALPATGRSVVLFDEISWMAMGDPDFPGHLKAAWDNLFSRKSGLIVVICGSVSSWIQTNILANTGFVGRCSWTVRLPPLALPACNQFWGKKKISAAEKLKVLAVTGGVPRYLEEIDPGQTAEQNIERLCFRPGGILFEEFGQIFHDIFTRRAEFYREIVTTLVAGSRSVSEIGERLGSQPGGSLSAAMQELELAGFVRREVAFDPGSGKNQPRTLRYRLADNYLRFFLKYVQPVAEQITKGLYQHAGLEALQAWDTVMGLQFENLIVENLPAVLAKTGLSRVAILNAGPFFQAKTLRKEACQVDLMLRSKQGLYVFELKFRGRIDKAVVGEVQEKVARLRIDRSLSVRTGLIYQGELDPAIEESDYFDYLLPFEELLQ